MLNITDKTKCSGCGACQQICPKNCIKMQADSEGFLYPKVDNNLCIKCGLCIKICPIINNNPSNKADKIFAAVNKDISVLGQSSSGGMFSVLAENILKQGGVVFGASFDKNFNVCHTFVEDIKNLDSLRRSKYVQSNTGDNFLKAKEFLDKNRFVLYCGTPCQIAGLVNYLGKDYPKLITAELICHGTPSPKVWRNFIDENIKNINHIASINFRAKVYKNMSFALLFSFKDGKTWPQINKLKEVAISVCPSILKGVLFEKLFYLPFMNGFSRNLYLRPSCHACSFKSANKYSDFTLADFWGGQAVVPQLYKLGGTAKVSLLILNSAKAKNVFEEIKDNLEYQEVDSLQTAVAQNPCYFKSTVSNSKRGKFFANIDKKPTTKLINKYVKQPFLIRLFRFIIKNLKK
ncbi:MAG: Coenzyme F420 hydrogenase/dehydrogenase, beta subunit C-terminal domain [Elusimicrobiota bacterium]|jgi:coenzyme F420-reducing hydrogenase beta subunit|nr:Coenzyme F420 hydrogenase/dehydrogenase, beta subunit C-terminal domain [Elusimicrobiota bacterium]